MQFSPAPGKEENSLAAHLKSKYGKLLIDYLAGFNFDYDLVEPTDNYDKLNSLSELKYLKPGRKNTKPEKDLISLYNACVTLEELRQFVDD